MDQFLQSIGQNVPRGAEPRLKLLEPPNSQEAFAENQNAPAIADHGDSSGD
jgi:hypothetical protein